MVCPGPTKKPPNRPTRSSAPASHHNRYQVATADPAVVSPRSDSLYSQMPSPYVDPNLTLRERFSAYWDAAVLARARIFTILPLAGWGLIVGITILNVVLGLLPIGFMVATAEMIGRVPAAIESGLGSPEWDGLVVLFLIAAGAFVAQQVLAPVQQILGLRIQRKVDGYVRDEAVDSITSSVGIGPLEDPEVLGKFAEARFRFENNWHTPGHASAGLLYLVARYVQVIALMTIVWVLFGQWIALALIASYLILRTGNRGGLRRYSAMWRRNYGIRRRLVYLRNLAMGSEASKEIRVFGSMGWLKGQHKATYYDLYDPVDKERRRIYFKPYLVYTAIALGVMTWGLVTLADRASGGELSSGAMTLRDLTLGLQAITAAMLLARDYPESDTSTQFGMNALTALREIARTVRKEDTAPRGDLPVPEGAPAKAIEFRDLHFGYPGANEVVFAGLNLTLEAGKTTAIVGVNGAGKTTLMKLLARLYEPTSGEILVDGVPIANLDIRAWRRALSVVFQDFVRYEFSAADNIATGAAFVPHDREAVEEAARKAGMLDVLRDAPKGLDTMLARGYTDGIDLSGGQWQRIAIARSLYALDKGARILVLDEPTAALDVRAEAAFFDQFVDLTQGATSLLISHRFSSVRRADRIVVIEHGAVTEEGTHEELMAADTHYRRLFELQARRFREGLEVSGDEDELEAVS